MPLVTYIDPKENAYEAEVPVGESAMQGAVDNMIDGILAECGGAFVCSTCHVIVDEKWIDTVGKAPEDEVMMLEASSEYAENSRLSCQLIVTDKMDGLVLRMPKSQY